MQLAKAGLVFRLVFGSADQMGTAVTSQQAGDLFRTNLDAGNDFAVAGDVNPGSYHEFFGVRKRLPALISRIFNDDGKKFTHILLIPIFRLEPYIK